MEGNQKTREKGTPKVPTALIMLIKDIILTAFVAERLPCPGSTPEPGEIFAWSSFV